MLSDGLAIASGNQTKIAEVEDHLAEKKAEVEEEEEVVVVAAVESTIDLEAQPNTAVVVVVEAAVEAALLDFHASPPAAIVVLRLVPFCFALRSFDLPKMGVRGDQLIH